jgi:sialic acid synthase SpsE
MTYIIGEIGQNHNGSVDIAKLIVDAAIRPVKEIDFNLELKPFNAIKLTKRDLYFELSKDQMELPYLGVNSFGRTYREHREFLELNDEEHFEIYKYAKEKGLDFIETLCSPTCLSLLDLFLPDKLKVASRDLTNLPLLERLAETKIPIILSTGMAGQSELDIALDIIIKHHENVSILHCVSQYPTHPDNANLNTIRYLIKKYPQFDIGYSDHTIGISAPVIAVGMGAKIIEKHITLDRSMKGTDQAGSLGIDGMNRMVRDIRIAEKFLGKESIFVDDSTQSAKIKLERSIAAKHNIKSGNIISESDIIMLSPGDGFKWKDRDLIIGKIAKYDIDEHQIIYSNLLEND